MSPSAAAAARGPEARAEVLRVIDGDTIEVELGGAEEDVRYIGIDTPESVVPGEPVECFGKEASAANERLVEGETVRLVFDAERRDHYGRLLAYVYVGEHVRQREPGRGRLRDHARDRAEHVAGGRARAARGGRRPRGRRALVRVLNCVRIVTGL